MSHNLCIFSPKYSHHVKSQHNDLHIKESMCVQSKYIYAEKECANFMHGLKSKIFIRAGIEKHILHSQIYKKK